MVNVSVVVSGLNDFSCAEVNVDKKTNLLEWRRTETVVDIVVEVVITLEVDSERSAT